MDDILALKQRISSTLHDADLAEQYGEHSTAMRYIADAAILIRKVRDLEEALELAK